METLMQKKWMPSRNTVKRKLISSAKIVESEVVRDVQTAILDNGIVGVTTDMWTDIKVRHFISL